MKIFYLDAPGDWIYNQRKITGMECDDVLKLFEATGFKNFRETIRLDFSDVRDYSFGKDCLSNGLLKNIMVYGKNAAGKTNIGLALFDIVDQIRLQYGRGLYKNFLNANGATGCAEFHYVFQFNTGTVDYRYRKDQRRKMLFEKMETDKNLIFEVDYANPDKGKWEGLHSLAPSLTPSLTPDLIKKDWDSVFRYVALIARFELEIEHPICRMCDYVNRMVWIQGSDLPREEHMPPVYLGYSLKADDYYDFIVEKNLLEDFNQLLDNAGVQEKVFTQTDGDGRKRLYFRMDPPLHFFQAASNGTLALYAFFYWYQTATNVSLLFIDEFDAFYHYELSEIIVRLLEKMNCQTILTTHNTNLMSNRIMRPDCYFVLSDGRLASFVNATRRTLREAHDLEHLYMGGEFGG